MTRQIANALTAMCRMTAKLTPGECRELLGELDTFHDFNYKLNCLGLGGAVARCRG